MKKKILVAAVAVASALVGTSAVAATKFGNPGQTGSLLMFPRIEAETVNNTPVVATGTGVLASTTDTLVHITNDGPNDVQIQCYWNTTTQTVVTGKNGQVIGTGANTGVSPDAAAARTNLRDQHARKFELVLKKGRTHSFWAGDLSGLANGSYYALGFGKLGTIDNVEQFNFFPDGAQANAGDLKCFAVQNGKEVKYNFLTGKATIFTFNDPAAPSAGLPTAAFGGQAHEYNAWAFQRLAAASAPGELKLDGKEYDECPAALTGSFIPSGHPFANYAMAGMSNVTQISLSSCNQNVEENSPAQVSLAQFTVVKSDGNKASAGKECIGAWYEGDLGEKFHAFSYGLLKSDQASFRIQSMPRKATCNQDQSGAYVNATDVRKTPGAIEGDVVESGLVGIQVNDVGGDWQTSSTLTGIDTGSLKYSGYYANTKQVNSLKY